MNVEQLVVECVEHRQRVAGFTDWDTPALALDALGACRQALDRVELILVTLTRLRGRAASASTAAKYAYDDAWDQAASAYRRGAGKDYSGPRERYAEFNLAAFSQALEARKADAWWKEIDVAVDAVRIIHRGIDSVRSDITTVLRAMNIETRLEGGRV